MNNMFLSGYKILIVEDEPESRTLLRSMLAELGAVDVYEVGDGRKALSILDDTPELVDFVLCDWNMPSLSGIQLLRQLRSACVTTPFMMITGRSDQQSVLEARNLGVAGYIRKPYSMAQIEAKLRILVSRMRAA